MPFLLGLAVINNDMIVILKILRSRGTTRSPFLRFLVSLDIFFGGDEWKSLEAIKDSNAVLITEGTCLQRLLIDKVVKAFLWRRQFAILSSTVKRDTADGPTTQCFDRNWHKMCPCKTMFYPFSFWLFWVPCLGSSRPCGTRCNAGVVWDIRSLLLWTRRAVSTVTDSLRRSSSLWKTVPSTVSFKRSEVME